ncbi:MAG TPA: Crp/Fnr family transcriptional regulator [Terracidiphilus sp.]|jgi:CRP-like cAMP-binding protein
MASQSSNLFLSSLAPSNYEWLASRTVEVELPLHTILYEEETAPRYAYFLTVGLASVVTTMSNGESVEVGFIGQEGVVGGLQLLGPAPLSTRCMMQLSGTALRISYSDLEKAFANNPEIRSRLLEFVQQQSIMVGQIAGCNRLHGSEQRLIRWLLSAQDRTHSSDLKFTHQYLAEMIASQRTTVSVIARDLQERGFIRYSRGIVQIVNREGLEKAACDCYAIIKSLYESLYSRPAPPASSP